MPRVTINGGAEAMTATVTPQAAAPGGVPEGGGSASGRPPLRRSNSDRLVAGVAAGIARHLRIPPVAVRIAFVVLLGFDGLGALLYAAYWAVLPTDADDPSTGRRHQPVTLLLLGGLAVAVLLVRVMGFGDGRTLTSAAGWLIALIAVGAGVIWHTSGVVGRRAADTAALAQRATVPAGTAPRAFLARLIGGGLLITAGLVGLAAVYAPVGGVRLVTIAYGVGFALLTLAGVGVVTAPMIGRIVGALRAEREARIREQERAELAAMVHDQVLHTLALIQRSAPAGSEAHRLARAQERSLRNWLYRPRTAHAGLESMLEQVAAEVEEAYPVTVELVVVGEDPPPRHAEQVEAVVAAAREALVNAARHAGVSTVSVYAEVEPDQLTVFVRDRGVGFDLAAVDRDRHGVRGSIIGRMERHGGQATIVTAPGEGTEVRLRLPLGAESRETG